MPSEPRSGIVADLVARLLNYMDRPWKAVVVIVLLMLLGAGAGLWAERATVARLLRPPPGPAVLKTDITGEIDDLIADHIDLVMVWSIDLASNTERYVDGRSRDRVLRFRFDAAPVVSGATNALALAQLLNGETWCDGLPGAGTPFGDELHAAGMTAMCVVPVPPSPTELLIGIIVLAWSKPPSASYQASAVALARSHALHMTLHN